MRKRQVHSLTVNELLDELYSLKTGKILRVAFKENDELRKQMEMAGMCESRFLTVADCDVRKRKDQKDGKDHFVFSIPIDHPNGDGYIIGEICCCFNKNISVDDMKEFILDNSEVDDEDTKYFIGVIRRYAGIEQGRNEYNWYEDWSDYQYDYDKYLNDEI